jgi:divalent metal cation (Fe/Co/Zn/Cd) transporter
MKIIASVLSNSLSIISSVIDSAVDLVSSIILFWTARTIRNRNQYRYPVGRTRLEPVAIIILSVIMCSASVQVLSEAIKRLFIYIQYITNYTKEIPEVNMNIKQPFPIMVMCITIGKIRLINIFNEKIKSKEIIHLFSTQNYFILLLSWCSSGNH